MIIEAMKLLVAEMEYVLDAINEDIVPFDGDDFHEALRLGRQAIEQAQKQEPVGFMCQGCFYELDDVDEYCEMEHVYLYTHPSPPQRQPLTDEQWQEIANLTGCLRIEKRGRDAIMRIFDEAAHGIKGEA